MNNTIKIKIGSQTFTATMLYNATTVELKTLLPLKVNMTELNGNEKYFHLSSDLPVEAIKPGTIQSGDLMLWGSNSLVIFYKTFSTSYSYTRLGKIDDPSGLADALGKGDV
ncbi:MAG: cyclophilin-like fold protein, partial [Flavitalea sp.]